MNNWKAKPLLLGSSERDYGYTVTAENQDTHQLITLTQPGPQQAALTDICEQIEALDGPWKIITVSNPRTIYRDLQGTRAREAYKGTAHQPTTRKPIEVTPENPEYRALARIGKHHLMK